MKQKKWVSLCLAALLSLGTILSGCESSKESKGGDNTGQSASSAPTASSSDTLKTAPMKLEIMTDSGGTKLPEGDNDRMKIRLDEKLNADIQLSLFDDYNQVNVRMAAGDYPDIISVNRISMQEYAKKGLLLDLTPYMEKLEQAKQFIGEDSLKKGTVDGKIYALAKKPSFPFFNIWIRKDWLEHLNLKVPTTLEEFLEVAKAFTENDPDGNNKKDTYGITGTGLAAFDPILTAFGVGTFGTFYKKDGKLMNSFYDPEMKDALKFINELVNAGVVDPDLLTNTGTQHEQKAFQGKVGMIWHGFPRMTFPERVKEYKAVNPDAEWVQVPALKGPGGQYAGTWDVGIAPGMHAISKSVEKDPEKLQKIFDLLNYVASPEGSTLVAHGEEVRHWNRENGKIVRTELRAKEHAFMYQLLGRNEMEYLQSGYPAEAIDFAANTPRIEVYNGLLDLPEGYNPADAERYMLEELMKFAYGKRPLSEYEDFLNTLETTFKYKLMLDSAEKQLKELGIIN